jgi:hypothetical protein
VGTPVGEQRAEHPRGRGASSRAKSSPATAAEGDGNQHVQGGKAVKVKAAAVHGSNPLRGRWFGGWGRG